jgi:hypothetical protein
MKKPTAPKKRRVTKPTSAPPADALLTFRPFPKAAINSPETFHDLGPVAPPSAQAKALGANLPSHVLEADARKLLDALNGSGPRQEPPHSGTACTLDAALARLRDYALFGDAAAFAALGFILRNAVADFHEIARRHPALAASWGETQNTLPALTGRNPGHAADLDAAFDRFRLGEKSPFRVNPPQGKKAPNINTAANVIAAGLCAHLDAHRRPVAMFRAPVPPWARLAAVLPDLDTATASAWVDAAWALLLETTGGHPEEFQSLAALGAKGARKDGLQSPATKAANVRAEIRQSIREAIHLLARKKVITPR